ncbi:MAG TPA: N-formylglutamate amidohydrolase [Patescibacteria group bacterium]|nr:N-formylglutamate amidohydrolase [Patescibacteria group bacterium]
METQPSHLSAGAVLEIISPDEQTVPLVFASPHSGCDYPAAFLAQAALDPQALRRSEDSFVDELFAAAPSLGAPLLKAHFPRAYVDVNREAFELDPAMFDAPLPPHVTTDSPRVAAGLGTVARVVACGAEIYRHKLSYAEVEQRINGLYYPYHTALVALIEQTRRRFGCCLLVDCHSMPSIGGPADSDTGTARVDFVLGDGYGSSCAAAVTRTAEQCLRFQGYRVIRNTPYAGGFTTRHYGHPEHGVHTLQIEINRRLYMNETTHVRGPHFAVLQSNLGALIAALAALPLSVLTP